MADQSPGIQCPACGSPNVAPVPLLFIQARYYKCEACIVTFRAMPTQPDMPDIERFNDLVSPPEGG